MITIGLYLGDKTYEKLQPLAMQPETRLENVSAYNYYLHIVSARKRLQLNTIGL